MKKLLLCTAIAATLGLTGCGGGGDDLSTIQDEAQIDKPFARVLFNPTDSELNIPNDALMLPATSLFDFTLELEDHDNFNPGDPLQGLGALDGWSTTHPFNISVVMPANLTIDSSSLANPNAIRIFEATQALEGTSATCQAIRAAVAAPGVPCEFGNELVLGQDFITQVSSPGTITAVPLRPLKPGQGYVLVVTEDLRDSDGRAVLGSTTWELARQDPDTHPLATPDQLQLQGLVDLILDGVATQGIARENVSYAAYFSTVSAGTVMGTLKQLQIGPFAQAFATALGQGADQLTALQTAAQFLPAILANEAPVDTVYDVLAPSILPADVLATLEGFGVNSCNAMLGVLADPTNPLAPTVGQLFPSVAPFCAAELKAGNINLPYYLSTTNPLGDFWRSACTNGAMLSALGAETVGGLVQTPGVVGPYNDLCQAASGGALFDLNLAAIGINDERFVTKVAPIPAPRGRNADGTETLDVQITVPNEAVMAAIAAADPTYTAPTKPAAGWPVIIVQHGITSKKEDTLLAAGTMALAGFATVAIDHPLHGSRGFVLEDGRVVNTSSGFGGSTTDYMNLASVLSARDNLRQSAIDTLGLRLGLNAVVDLTGGTIDLDASNVYLMGQSLGSITGTNTIANANTTLGGQLAAFDSMYEIKAAGLSVPGGGIAQVLLESGSFGSLVKGSLVAASSADFQAFIAQFAAQAGIPASAAVAPAFDAFWETLDSATKASLNATFASFVFAAQSMLEAGDPVNYAARAGANTPIMLHEVVGGGTNDDGSTALPDQTIPNTTALPLYGTEALAAIMGLPSVSSTTVGEEPVSGIVRFITGEHGSLLNPTSSAAATVEMQRQMAAYFASGATAIVVTDPSVVAN